MLNNIYNDFDNENIITKSQMYEKMKPNNMLGESFAKTVNCNGIHNNFFLDIPEIIEDEKRQQQRRDDIAKFTKLAISDFDTTEDNERVEELFKDKSVMSAYTDEILESLIDDEDFLNDIGF